jgi:hypothetical protein
VLLTAHFISVLCVVLRDFRKIWIDIISIHMFNEFICRIRTAYLWQITWIVLRDVFLASIFLAYVEPKLFFSLSRGKIVWRKMVRSTHAVRKIRSIRNCTVEYHTYVGKRPATKQRTAPWEKSTKSTSVRKKIPLSSQVHTTDIPRDMRAHMDKSAFYS